MLLNGADSAVLIGQMGALGTTAFTPILLAAGRTGIILSSAAN